VKEMYKKVVEDEAFTEEKHGPGARWVKPERVT
jgi:hypothetical protein